MRGSAAIRTCSSLSTPAAAQSALTLAGEDTARGGGPGSCLPISWWQELPLEPCRCCAGCPAPACNPHSSTTSNREGQLSAGPSSQSCEECTTQMASTYLQCPLSHRRSYKRMPQKTTEQITSRKIERQKMDEMGIVLQHGVDLNFK